jgi:hypothetical protein
MIILYAFNFGNFEKVKKIIILMPTLGFTLAILLSSQALLPIPLNTENKSKLKENESCTEDFCKTLSPRRPMTYTFYQNMGIFVGRTGDYTIDTHGYSDQSAGYLKPEYQCV